MTHMSDYQKRMQNAPTEETELYVGPGWVRDEWKMEELLDDASVPPRPVRLTCEDIVRRAENKQKEYRKDVHMSLRTILGIMTILIFWAWWIVKSTASSIGQ